MASLREIKGRIGSINTTLKITSAMKMVASAKLHKAQKAIERTLPYEGRMRDILSRVISASGPSERDVFEERPVSKVALICFSSNSSLCGSFNYNVIRKTEEIIAEYREEAGIESISVFSIGRKMAEAMAKKGFDNYEIAARISETKSYDDTSILVKQLSESFHLREFDKIELVYSHLKSLSSQPVIRETLLPFEKNKPAVIATGLHRNFPENGNDTDYILEPDKEELLDTLIPQYLNHKVYSVLLDSAAAEYAARTVAMQTASDNGEDLLQELTIEYNKSRQQKITDELLDIVGGSL